MNHLNLDKTVEVVISEETDMLVADNLIGIREKKDPKADIVHIEEMLIVMEMKEMKNSRDQGVDLDILQGAAKPGADQVSDSPGIHQMG